MAILRDVGETLKKLLQQKIPELADENSIVFDSPADIESTTTPKLSVFLYQVIENSYMRNAELNPVNLTQMQYPPLIVDLFYLFTPYAQNRETELIILEKLMQVFHDNSVFKGEMLKESLKGSGNEEIRVIANNISFEDLNKLWERFPNKTFKLSISYILTPVRIPSERKKDLTRVIEKSINLYKVVS